MRTRMTSFGFNFNCPTSPKVTVSENPESEFPCIHPTPVFFSAIRGIAKNNGVASNKIRAKVTPEKYPSVRHRGLGNPVCVVSVSRQYSTVVSW